MSASDRGWPVRLGTILARMVGLSTAASGAALVVAPRPSLCRVGAGTTEPAPLLFGAIGMFMAMSGGILVDGCRTDPPSKLALRWSLAQKVGVAGAICLGVRKGQLGRQALGVAAFDGGSAVLIAWLLLNAET